MIRLQSPIRRTAVSTQTSDFYQMRIDLSIAKACIAYHSDRVNELRAGIIAALEGAGPRNPCRQGLAQTLAADNLWQDVTS